MASNSLIQIILLLICVELVGLSAMPLSVRLFPWSIGNTFAISRILGQILLGSLLWVIVSLGLVTSSYLTIVGSLLFVFTVGHALSRGWLAYLKQENLALTISYYLIFILFLSCRYFHPEIHWGEKPMDFTFLNYFYRLNTLPPTEPWASGLVMHYYYGGYLFYSALLKLAHVSPDYGYNIIVSLIPALYSTGLYCVFRSLKLSARYALASTVIMAMASDPEMVISVLSEWKLDSHLYWASTRIYPSPGFTEYPFWTFLFADLHPHFMALPYVVFFILVVFNATKNNFKLVDKLLASLCLSFILLVNAWDGITCSFLLAFFWVASQLFYRPSWKFIIESVVFLFILCLFCLPIVFCLKTSNNQMNIIWAVTEEFHSLSVILRLMGGWLCALFLCLCFSMRSKINYNTFLLSILLAITSAILIAVSQYCYNNSLPWSLVAFFFALTLGFGFSKFAVESSWPQVSILALFSFWFFIVVEFIVLIDRMNSVFKFHYFLWTSFAITALVLIYYQAKTSKFLAASLLLPVAIVSISGSLFSLWLAYTQGFHWNLVGVQKGINGFRYYQDYNYRDADIIKWLRANAEQRSTIVEAYGPSYQDYTRISTNTGIPTILGWDFHVSQRGVSQYEIQNRKTAIKAIYENKNLDVVCDLLKNYHVNYLVMSELEKKTYNIDSNTNIEAASCLKVEFRTGSSFVAKVIS